MGQGSVADKSTNPTSLVEIDLDKESGADVVEGVEIYTVDGIDGAIRNGAVISNVFEYVYDPLRDGAEPMQYPYVIVVSQDCDLDWDYRYSQGEHGVTEEKAMSRVLLIEAKADASLNSSARGRVSRHLDERFHFLPTGGSSVDVAGSGLPELVIDFKHCFSVPVRGAAGLYEQLGSGSAVLRCRLSSPYREHLQERFTNFLGRVALPAPYPST